MYCRTESKRLSEAVQQLVFVGPALLFFCLIVLVPFLMSFYYSLTDWNGVTTRVVWTGLDNFRTHFAGRYEFRNSFWFTARYTLAAVVLANAVGFALALLLTQPLKTRNVLRTVFFCRTSSPVCCSGLSGRSSS